MATSHGIAISAQQGAQCQDNMFCSETVCHTACVSCPSVAALRCDCSLASMVVHETHPSRRLACESCQPSWPTRAKHPIAQRSKSRVATHLTTIAHYLWKAGTGRRCPHGCLRGPALPWAITPPPHYPYQWYDKGCDPSLALRVFSTSSANLGTFDAVAEAVSPT